eukprot:CAMPEP_0170578882 /NCGR_PEP_ID=MMETSP0224-20130122/5690_1 /TAXON_ID=285029 /ORGANISM="Togula jolla, Strain CCCM 725" /LENGTH=327 /DNA_ID=CAMNT_0010901875 /DNA_START=80 /DNA_END=1063 /DNA_ORIENTATION=-
MAGVDTINAADAPQLGVGGAMQGQESEGVVQTSRPCGRTDRGSTRHPWQVLSEAMSAFFSSNSENHDDPLVDVVRRDPSAASRFIRTVMVFSGVGSVVVCIACAVFLSLFWRRCAVCDRPLRWWLLVHTSLQLAQIPVRFVFLVKMRRVETVGGSLEACVASFTASPAWKISKNVSLFTYGWFVLGIVWAVNAGDCTACPGVYRMTIAVIVQAVARAVVALACFRLLFPHSEQARAEAPKVEAAGPDQIAQLPLLHYWSGLFSESGASCAVCLCEYESSDMLRRLPCGHHFHRKCADQWLRRSKRCPLCMRAIDAGQNPCCKTTKVQ